MKEVALIFPNQLFLDNPILDKNREIILLEHPRYFTNFLFHKQKLLLHRASMKQYYNKLKKENYSITYVEFSIIKKYLNSLPRYLNLHIVDPVDHNLEEEIILLAKNKDININWYESPMFLTTSDWIKKNFGLQKKYLMNSFYIKQRKRLNILLENNKPIGGKWSFDKENREKIDDSIKIPKIPKLRENEFIKEAREYVVKNFAQNPGSTDSFIYPTNHLQAKEWFESFLKNRFSNFGVYQDAMIENEDFLFHSVLTPILNTGLITPAYIINETLNYAKNNKISINNLEGFIRQIIGWREFVRAIYILIGKEQKKSNFFNHSQKIPKSFYCGTTSIEPINSIIKKLLNNGYSHHIERLMLLGNFMLMLEIKPDEVYNWFMEMYIDSYDWVMVPNVYGMSQYADTRITTKPYICSSNYILKMSNYKKGEWCNIWDAFFWSFIKKNKNKLSTIPRMKFMIYGLNKKTKKQLLNYKKIVSNFKS